MHTPIFSKVVNGIARRVGLSVDELRSVSPESFRDYLTTKTGKPFGFCSEFPYIGRGNVLRDNLATTTQINAEIDQILRG